MALRWLGVPAGLGIRDTLSVGCCCIQARLLGWAYARASGPAPLAPVSQVIIRPPAQPHRMTGCLQAPSFLDAFPASMGLNPSQTDHTWAGICKLDGLQGGSSPRGQQRVALDEWGEMLGAHLRKGLEESGRVEGATARWDCLSAN